MTWITLAACILVAVFPASGFVLCMGHDGHFNLGAAVAQHGNDSGHASCPCATAPAAQPGDEHGEEHPLCRDLLVDESPLAFSQAGGWSLDLDGASAGHEPQALAPSLSGLPWRHAPVTAVGAPWEYPPGDPPRQSVVEQSTVVLLI